MGRKRRQGTSSSRCPSPCCVGAQQRRWPGIQSPKWWEVCPMALGCPSKLPVLLELLPILEPSPSFPIPTLPGLGFLAEILQKYISEQKKKSETQTSLFNSFDSIFSTTKHRSRSATYNGKHCPSAVDEFGFLISLQILWNFAETKWVKTEISEKHN